jgi:hypothetical protein
MIAITRDSAATMSKHRFDLGLRATNRVVFHELASAPYNAGVAATSPLRRMLLAVLVLGMAGSLADLLLLAHYEDTAQLIPLVLLAGGIVTAVFHAARPTAATVRALQGVMAIVVVAALAGVGFHFNGAAEFQFEIDPSQSWWDVAGKVARAQSPPVLAPGAMLQLGLIGLVYTYRHPVTGNDRAFEDLNR